MGANQMGVYSFQYADSGSQVALDFSKGLVGWGVEPDRTALVQLGSDGSGPFLQFSATAGQYTYVNSSTFTVTPGSSYTLTISARIAPGSDGSGNFSLVFLNSGGKESSRDTLNFIPGSVILGTPQTGGDGSYIVQFSPPSDGEYQLQASYAGSNVFWPGLASLALNAGLPACVYSISPGGQGFTSAGGTGAIGVTAPQGCSWSSSNAPNWVIFFEDISGNGTGGGTLNYEVLPNTGASRSGIITVAGSSYAIEQEGGSLSGLSFVGSMPHLAAEGGWTTTFTFLNKSAASAIARTSLFTSGGAALALPLSLPQQAQLPGSIVASSLDQTILPNGQFVMEATGPANVNYTEGSAQLAATGAVDGFAIFHFDPSSQEAVIPVETRNAASYFLAFDNTNNVLTGVALENVSPSVASIPVVIRDDTGRILLTPTITLPPFGHMSCVLTVAPCYTQTANIRGTAEFDTPSGGQISVLGIRYTPPGTMTTIPAFANVGTAGGSMAHLAAGDGWQTTFALVNTGTSPATESLKFYDDSGNPLGLTVSFPQTGTGLATRSTTYSQEIAPGASLWVQVTVTAETLQTGSAQMTTTGNVGGFAIFRYNTNGQEAVVPLESRNASGYVVAFDNTNGVSTGVAIANASAQGATIPVTLRDGAGNSIGAGSITLGANGHTSFVLGSQYPSTAGLLGTAEFGVPSGGSISVLGIRSPPALTFTTLPPLAK
jgi:hypothetical protein